MARKKPSVQDVEFAIADTADRAKSMLDDEGNLRGEEEYLKLLTVDTVFRPVKPSDRTNPRPGLGFISWRGKLMVYDANLAAGFMAGAKSGDYVCDQVVCNAAALVLSATKAITDNSLRNYTIEALCREARPKRDARGTNNIFRDHVIWRWLMIPLVKAGFNPTRNEATESESATSIVSQALKRIGLELSERRIAEIWSRVEPLLHKGKVI